MNAAAAEQRPWTQAGEGLDAMAHMSNELEDLSNIFNIGDFDLEAIQNVSGQPQQYGADGMHGAHTDTHPTTPYLETMPQAQHGNTGAEHNAFALPVDVDGQQYDEQQFQAPTLYQQQLSQHYSHIPQSPYQQQHFNTGGQIPPTPNSYEMHGETGRFLQQQQQVMYEQQKQLRKLEQQRQMHQHQQQQQQLPQHAQFTPMASPDGTPQYAIQTEFTTPGAYFSPLTSPALHAQLPPASSRNLVQQAQGYFTNPSTAPNSNAPSPVDLNGNDVEMADSLAMAEANKRAKRRIATPRSVGQTMTNSRPRQSPIQKPQKRKSGLLTSIVPPKELDKMLTESAHAHHAPGVPHFMQNMDSSESGSISPEPLSESLMGPPPRPSQHSPAMNAQQHTSIPQHMQHFGSGKAAAATPKSILSMRSQQQVDGAGGVVAGHAMLDELELPEAAKKQALRPSLTTIDVVNVEAPGSRKTPKLGPLSTPSSLRPGSSSASPVTFSPVSGGTPTGLMKDKKGDSKARTAKKRGSVSGAVNSALASPALRPRISPSIKPLLPEGSALHSPTHALLLASKSNYQNLLEGNHLPGVSYPDSLSTGLTSKRTSHKVAEQGRRNRINEALKEMQSLIPSPSLLAKQSGSEDANASKDEDGSPEALNDDGKDGKDSAKSNSSKAATVESANRYIRLLKESDASQRAAILALQRENEEIRRHLARATGVPDEEMTSIEEVDDMQSPSS